MAATWERSIMKVLCGEGGRGGEGAVRQTPFKRRCATGRSATVTAALAASGHGRARLRQGRPTLSQRDSTLGPFGPARCPPSRYPAAPGLLHARLACGTAAASRLARRVKMRSVRPTRAEAAGTKEPTWARKVMRATCGYNQDGPF